MAERGAGWGEQLKKALVLCLAVGLSGFVVVRAQGCTRDGGQRAGAAVHEAPSAADLADLADLAEVEADGEMEGEMGEDEGVGDERKPRVFPATKSGMIFHDEPLELRPD